MTSRQKARVWWIYRTRQSATNPANKPSVLEIHDLRSRRPGDLLELLLERVEAFDDLVPKRWIVDSQIGPVGRSAADDPGHHAVDRPCGP